MPLWAVRLGTSRVLARGIPVIGERLLPANQRSMAARSYVKPSVVITGSAISSVVMGQW